MKPTDFPVERLAELELQLIGLADAQRQRARVNSVGSSVDPDPTEPLAIPGPPEGFYESALSYYESARMAKLATDDIVRDLAKRGADESANTGQQEHPWPVPQLTNLTTAYPDSWQGPVPDGYPERFPKWGVVSEQQFDPSAQLVTAFPAAAVVGGFFLRVAEGPSDLDSPATNSCTIRLDYDQWDALVALVARMRAGEPIPYDEAGNVRGPQPQESGQ